MNIVNEYLELSESLKRTFLVYRKGSSESLWLNEYENEIYQKLKQSDTPLSEKEIFISIKHNFNKAGSAALLDVMVCKRIIDVDVIITDNCGIIDAVKVYSTD